MTRNPAGRAVSGAPHRRVLRPPGAGLPPSGAPRPSFRKIHPCGICPGQARAQAVSRMPDGGAAFLRSNHLDTP